MARFDVCDRDCCPLFEEVRWRATVFSVLKDNSGWGERNLAGIDRELTCSVSTSTLLRVAKAPDIPACVSSPVSLLTLARN